jgi:uroporphyrinogen-III synthase
MMTPRPLAGIRVGILQTRHAGELATLVEREGGVPLLAPCLREVRVEDRAALREALEEVAREPVDLFVFQTGVGTTALLEAAADLGLADRLAERVRSATVVARGPKPLTVLLKAGFRIDRRTPEPHTTAELVELLRSEDVEGRRVAVQHYGSPNLALVEHLRERRAAVIELESYRWALPEDPAPVLHFLDELAAGRVTVAAFTSASQVENLFTLAGDVGSADRLAGWLNRLTITAAIGPTCARALEEHGVAVALRPERPKMAPFVRAIGQHFQVRRTASG